MLISFLRKKERKP